MAIIDNTLAAQTPVFNPATPLMQAAKIQEAQVQQQQEQFKLRQAEVGAEARGLAPFVNTPEFPARWAETADRLAQKGLIDPQTHQKWRNAPSPLLLKQMIAQTEDPTLAFQKERAVVTDKQSDRQYGLNVRAANRADEGVVDEADDRAKAAVKYGLKPGTPEFTSYTLGGSLTSTGPNKIDEDAAARERQLKSRGMDTATPQNQQFILTGKYPREDAQPLTATDKKAILEADEGILSATTAIDALTKAKALSKEAFAGPMSGKRGYVASFLGESSDLGKGGIATAELDNVVTSNALTQLKAIFGGAPTEGERKILLDIQGSVNQPHDVRVRIYDRAIQMASARLKFNEQRANELRGGQFYKPQGSARAPVAQTQGISEAEYAKLPKGSKFIAPDGSERVKP